MRKNRSKGEKKMNPGRLRGSRLASLAALKYFFLKLLTVEVQSEVGGNIK